MKVPLEPQPGMTSMQNTSSVIKARMGTCREERKNQHKCQQLPNCHVSLKGSYGAFVNGFPNPLTPLIIHTVVNVFNLQSSDTRDLKINC